MQACDRMDPRVEPGRDERKCALGIIHCTVPIDAKLLY